MRTDLLMVTFAKDLPFAEYAMQSAARFCKGFGEFVIVVPFPSVPAFQATADLYGFTVKGFEEREGCGFLHHMAIITEADVWCPQADVIVHTDADCIWMAHCTPADYLVDGKPVMYREKFEDFRERHPGRYDWKRIVHNAVGIDPEYECMCRHPSVHLREVYALTRAAIAKHTGMDWREYILSGKNDFPQSYAEFPSLGAVALAYLADKYHWVDYSGDRDYEYERGRDFLKAFWSHCGIDGAHERHPGRTAREVIEEILA